MSENSKIGLLGGSFNPAHEGHLHISEHAANLLGLDEVWWLVSPQNPLKSTDDMASLEDRVKSAESITSNSTIKVKTIESELGTQYTIDTIKALDNKYSTTKFIWLIGADNLEIFDKWKDWQDIFNNIPIAVLDREPYSTDAMASIAAKEFELNRLDDKQADQLINSKAPAWVYLNIPTHPASSTAIRN